MTMRGATLNRVIQTAVDRGQSATDRELLHRFAEQADQEAFEALVRRHTGLVLSVCRRALSNDQDAEDACQATFLILARKARSGRWQPSIANWLFATARKVARDQRRAAGRRARREGRAAVPESAVPVDQMTGRELLEVIDDELDRLPLIYREPLLLYYQAELARDEIASRLGVPAGTVKIRLERGRKRLGDALTKRGVMLSAGLLTLMATSPAGASSPRFVKAVVAAATGSPRPAVAELAEGIAVNGFLKQIGFIVLAVVVTVGLGYWLGSGVPTAAGPLPEKGPPAKSAPAKEAPEAGTIAYSGRVLGPDGKPIIGAKLLVTHAGGYFNRPEPSPEYGASGPDGRFAFNVPKEKFGDT